MKIIIMIFFLFHVSCQSQNKDAKKVEDETKLAKNEIKPANQQLTQCDEEICLEIINHDKNNKSFEIYMINNSPVAGFQCDFSGINILGSEGGLLKSNDYQTSNNENRILSFSMQAKLIPEGEGVLTKILYSEPIANICMTGIIFAGVGGEQLSNNVPKCINLN